MVPTKNSSPDPNHSTPPIRRATFGRALRSQALGTIRRVAQRFGYLVVEWPGPGLRRDLRRAINVAGIDLVLDVGAHDGEFGAELRHLGYKGAIVSFEPSPEQLDRLRVRAAAEQNWSVQALALSSSAGTATLHRYADGHFDSLHHGEARGGRFAAGLALQSEIVIKTVRLDAVWNDVVRSGATVLLKVDTQGHDLKVIEGAGDRLANVALIQCEVAETPLYEGAPTLGDVLARLRPAGFSLASLEPVSRGPDHLTVIEFDCLFVNRRVPPFDWA